MDAPGGSAGREGEELQRVRQRAAEVSAADVARELDVLRARAYGPDSDIGADPVAMARLIELEAAHVAAATPVSTTASVDNHAAHDAPRSENAAVGPVAPKTEPVVPTTSGERPRQKEWRLPALTQSRAWWMVGSVVSVTVVLYAAIWILSPHPEATLQSTAAEPDIGLIQTLTANAGDPDMSTLRQFEQYRDIAVWSVENGRGDNCLLAWDREGGRFEYQCQPPAIELALHMRVLAEVEDGFGDWLADGSVISLHLRQDTVDVFVHPPAPAD